jgi:hypothetical protein
MFNRVALFAASLVASGVLAAGLALAGFHPGPAAIVPSAQPAAATAAAPAPITQIDTVYVAPAPTPQQITIQQVVTAQTGDDGDEAGGD